MLILKDKPFGIDTVINDINQRVYDALNWKTDADVPINYTAYHRADKNPKIINGNEAVIPEGYVYEITPAQQRGKGEYKELFYDDTLDASSFFYTEDTIGTTDNGNLNETVLSMVFQVNLNEVANNINHRGDEEIHSKVYNAIKETPYGEFVQTVKTIPAVYSEFDTSQITYTDMQGFHCFRMDINVRYEYRCCVDCDFAFDDDTGFLELEGGGFILLEDGFRILLE